ncbi:MAG: hypothetical protein WC683_06005 [bacterium]
MTDDELTAIEKRGDAFSMPGRVTLSVAERDDLCAEVRRLKAENEDLRGQVESLNYLTEKDAGNE